ncbi:uncharacterized protein EI90DRAFT_3075355 [Cantharellus anzutake]|uniref:uncharacterized protein n=1 Tax=Cantharellus anzutake TaxID=1750568 RepID=UPI0019036899|nr:uncharacterized protein EI90DRAFT_3075355 [Cantharellus anzutake]KAF8324431.1 hypothetical protein EI90DRAFT_3075355 [Cantharellus anzutake]
MHGHDCVRFMRAHQFWARWKRAQRRNKGTKDALDFFLISPFSFSDPAAMSDEGLPPDHEEEDTIIYITSQSNPLLSSLSSSEESLSRPTTPHAEAEPPSMTVDKRLPRPLPVAPGVPLIPTRKVRALPTPPDTPPATQRNPITIPPRLEIATKMLQALADATDSPIVLATGLPTPSRGCLTPFDLEIQSISTPIDWKLLEEALGCC